MRLNCHVELWWIELWRFSNSGSLQCSHCAACLKRKPRSSEVLPLISDLSSEGQGVRQHCGPCFPLLLHPRLQAWGLPHWFSPCHRPFSRLPSCCPWKGSRGGWCWSSLCTGTGPFPAVWSQASSVIFGLLLWQSEYTLPFTICLYLGRTHKPKDHHVS